METTEDILEQATSLLANVVNVPALDDSRLVRVMELTENGRIDVAEAAFGRSNWFHGLAHSFSE